MKHLKVYLACLTLITLSFITTACVKPLNTIAPSGTASTPTPGLTVSPTATSTCAITPIPDPSFAPPNTGIYMSGTISGHQTYTSGSNSFILLTVNGLADSTAAVTLTGSDGTMAPLTYTGTQTMNSYTLASYNASNNFTYNDGTIYTVTVITGIGTASCSVTSPGTVTFAPDGSSVTWSTDATYEPIYVRAPDTSYWQPATCNHQKPPIAISTTAYAYGHGNYVLDANFENVNTTVIGGTGGLSAIADEGITVTK